MVWFKVDDNLAFHRKTLAAGNAAMGMWVRAGSEIAQQLTDGFVPNDLVLLLGGHKLAAKLVSAGFWLKVDGGYRFHEWNAPGRQPTRAAVEAERHAAAERKERWKEQRRNAVQNGDRTATERRSERPRNGDGTPTHARAATRPDPTRPEKIKNKSEHARDPHTDNPVDQLLTEHVDSYRQPIPLSAISDWRNSIHQLLDENITDQQIRAGLTRCRDRKLGPKLLAQAVAETTGQNGYTAEQLANLTEGQLLNLEMYGTIHAPARRP